MPYQEPALQPHHHNTPISDHLRQVPKHCSYIVHRVCNRHASENLWYTYAVDAMGAGRTSAYKVEQSVQPREEHHHNALAFFFVPKRNNRVRTSVTVCAVTSDAFGTFFWPGTRIVFSIILFFFCFLFLGGVFGKEW